MSIMSIIFIPHQRKSSGKFLNCRLPLRFLKVKIMGCHIDICVSHHALNRL